MKKILLAFTALALAASASAGGFGQTLRNAASTVSSVSGSTNSAVQSSAQTTRTVQSFTKSTNNNSSSVSSSASKTSTTTSAAPKTKGAVYYVSSANGNNRNEGTKDAPLKNIQKALDLAPESGATIFVAEGNYFGTLNSGNIVISKPVLLYGGYSVDFNERDILKHKTMVQPTAASNGTQKGSGTIQIGLKSAGEVLIDGLIIDRGNSIAYNPRQEGKPDGVLSPMMQPIGTAGIGGKDLTETGVFTAETALIYLNSNKGTVTIRNCALINGPNHGILGGFDGKLVVENNIFVNIRMDGIDVSGYSASKNSVLEVKNNTMLFIWARKKDLGDMGYGVRYRPRVDAYVTGNLIGCTTFAALDRTHVDSPASKEAQRISTAENNIFFLNRQADLTLPGGGLFMRVRAEDFDDVDQLTKASGNKTLSDPALLNGKVDKAYLKGFLNLKYSETTSVDYNSSANQFRSALGMNQVGTMTSTVSMFCNRYPWEDALKLFGAVSGCGAQLP